MKASRFVTAGLILVLALSSLAVLAQATPPQKQEPAKPAPKQPQKEILPKEIKAIIQDGLATRQGRHDIPFTVTDTLYFWAPNSIFTVVIFKAKNADLGYAAPAPAAAPPKDQPAPAAPPAGILEARLTASLEFFQTDDKGNLTSVREDGFPAVFQTESAGYDPNKEDWYSLWYALPYGKYTMALLLAPLDPKKHAPDLKKVGVGYVDLALPGPEATQTALDTTSVVFVKSAEQMPQPENRHAVHREYFTWGALKIVPLLGNVLAAGDNLQAELFFFVLGAKPKPAPADQTQPSSQPTYDVEINYEVQKEDGSSAIKWTPQTYQSFFIYQALPLKRTLKTGEKVETKDLEPGKYNLVLKIMDKVSSLTGEKKIPFEVK